MNLQRNAFLNALATAVYICLVVLLISNLDRMIGPNETILMPMMALLLFVLSAAITGSLVVGKPLLMFLNGQKTEAVKLFLYIVGWLAVYTGIFIFLNTIR